MGNDSLFGSDDDSIQSQDDVASEQGSALAEQQLENGLATDDPNHVDMVVASLEPPSIKGFYLLRDLIPLEIQELLMRRILDERAITAQHPQAMLFPRSSMSGKDVDNCPEYLSDFVGNLPQLLRDYLSPEDLAIVFDERQSLQTILNLYEPGQGITPHVSNGTTCFVTSS